MVPREMQTVRLYVQQRPLQGLEGLKRGMSSADIVSLGKC